MDLETDQMKHTCVREELRWSSKASILGHLSNKDLFTRHREDMHFIWVGWLHALPMDFKSCSTNTWGSEEVFQEPSRWGERNVGSSKSLLPKFICETHNNNNISIMFFIIILWIFEPCNLRISTNSNVWAITLCILGFMLFFEVLRQIKLRHARPYYWQPPE